VRILKGTTSHSTNLEEWSKGKKKESMGAELFWVAVAKKKPKGRDKFLNSASPGLKFAGALWHHQQRHAKCIYGKGKKKEPRVIIQFGGQTNAGDRRGARKTATTPQFGGDHSMPANDTGRLGNSSPSENGDPFQCCPFRYKISEKKQKAGRLAGREGDHGE